MSRNRVLAIRALSPQILCVATETPFIGEWTAYIGVVPGLNHVDEADAIAKGGDKMAREIAEAVFAWDLSCANGRRVESGNKPLKWRA